VVRLLVLSWWLHLKAMSRSWVHGLLQVMWPLLFATTTLLIYRVGGEREVLLYPALGGTVMAIWSAISTTASGILQRERGLGTLELLVAAPTPFALTILPVALAVSTMGIYGMVATLLWANLAFGVRIDIADPVVFAAAVGMTVLSIAALGFVLSVTVVRYRAAWALGNALEYPVWLICGLVVPASYLPGSAHTIALALAPTWGMRAMRDAASGAPATGALAACAGLGLAYAAVGTVLAEYLLRSARRHATLTLS